MATQWSDLIGMVPWDVDVERGLVRFGHAGGLRFSEPFYTESLLRAPRGGRSIDLSFEDLRGLVGDEGPSPKGVVIHTGRCGSTLLARMLLHDRTVIVFSEPGPLAVVHEAVLRDGSFRPVGEQLLADLLVALDRFAAARGQRAVVKLTSWQAVDLGGLLSLVDAPFVFLHRAALDVVASDLATPPGWERRLDDAAWMAAIAPDAADERISTAERYAAVWAAIVRAVVSVRSPRVTPIAYEDLLASPADVLGAIATALGLGGLRVDAAANELRYYSKSVDPTQPFDPAVRHARPPLDPAARDAVLARVAVAAEELAAIDP